MNYNDIINKMGGLSGVEPKQPEQFSSWLDLQDQEIATAHDTLKQNMTNFLVSSPWSRHQAREYSPQRPVALANADIQKTEAGWSVFDSKSGEHYREFKSQPDNPNVLGGDIGRWQAVAYAHGGFINFESPDDLAEFGYEGDATQLNFSDQFKERMKGVMGMSVRPEDQPTVLPSELLSFSDQFTNTANGLYHSGITRSSIFVSSTHISEPGSYDEAEYTFMGQNAPKTEDERRLYFGIHEFSHFEDDRLNQQLGRDKIQQSQLEEYYSGIAMKKPRDLSPISHFMSYMMDEDEAYARASTLDKWNRVTNPKSQPRPTARDFSPLGFSPNRTGEHYAKAFDEISEAQRLSEAHERAQRWGQSRTYADDEGTEGLFKELSDMPVDSSYSGFQLGDEPKGSVREGQKVINFMHQSPFDKKPQSYQMGAIGNGRYRINKNAGNNRNQMWIVQPTEGDSATPKDIIKSLFSKNQSPTGQLSGVRGSSVQAVNQTSLLSGAQLNRYLHGRLIPGEWGKRERKDAIGRGMVGDAKSTMMTEGDSFFESMGHFYTQRNEKMRNMIQPVKNFGKRAKIINPGRTQGMLSTGLGQVEPTHSNFFRPTQADGRQLQSQLALEARSMVGATMVEGASDIDERYNVATLGEFTIPSSKASGIELGVPYGDTRGFGDAPRGKNIARLRNLIPGLSKSAISVVPTNISDIGNGQSLVSTLMHNNSMVEKDSVKPAYAKRPSGIMPDVTNITPESLRMGRNRADIHSAGIPNPTLVAQRHLEGTYLHLGEEAYNQDFNKWAEGKDLSGSVNPNIDFAVDFFTKGITRANGEDIGGFKRYTSDTKLQMSKERLGMFVADQRPDDGAEWLQNPEDNRWHRALRENEDSIFPIVGFGSVEESEHGYKATINDLMHVSPVVVNPSPVYSREIAQRKYDSLMSAESTNTSFMTNILRMQSQGAGKSSAHYFMLADFANRQKDGEGEAYLARRGYKVVDMEDIDEDEIDKLMPELPKGETLTPAQRSEYRLQAVGNMHPDAFLMARAGSKSSFFAPATEMSKQFVMGNDEDNPVNNIAIKAVNAIDSALSLKIDPEHDGMRSVYNNSVAQLLGEQRDYVSNPSIQEAGMSFFSPKMGGTAQSAKGLAENEVAVWLGDMSKRTGISKKKLRSLIESGKFSLGTVRYPQSDKTASVIGLKPVIMDDKSDEELEDLGVSKDPTKYNVSETAIQAMTGDFDGDLVAFFASHFKHKGKIVGGKQKVHTAEEVRRLAMSRPGSEVASNLKKVTEATTGSASERLTRMGEESKRPMNIADALSSMQDFVEQRSSVGQFFNVAQRKINPIANEILDQSGMKPKSREIRTQKQAIANMTANFSQGVIDLKGGAKQLQDIANLQYGSVIGGGGGRIRLVDGDFEGNTDYSTSEATKEIIRRFSRWVGTEEGDGKRLLAETLATSMMTPAHFADTTTFKDNSDRPEYVNQDRDKLASMIQGFADGEPITNTSMFEMGKLVTGDDKAHLSQVMFGMKKKDGKDISPLLGAITGLIGSNTNRRGYNHQLSGNAMLEDMSSLADSTIAKTQAGLVKAYGGNQEGGSVEKALLMMNHPALTGIYGSPEEIMSMRSQNEQMMDSIRGMMSRDSIVGLGSNMAIANMGGNTHMMNLAMNRQRPEKALMTENQLRLMGNFTSASNLNHEWGESDLVRNTRLSAGTNIPQEFLYGMHSGSKRPQGMSQEEFLRLQQLTQETSNVSRTYLGLNQKKFDQTTNTLTGTAIHEKIQRAMLGDLADIDNISFDKGEPQFNTKARAEVRIEDLQNMVSGHVDMFAGGYGVDMKTSARGGTDISKYAHQLSSYDEIVRRNQGRFVDENVSGFGVMPLGQNADLSAEELMAGSASTVKDLIAKIRGAKDASERASILQGVYGSEYLQNSKVSTLGIADYMEHVNNRFNQGNEWKSGIIPMLGEEAVGFGAVNKNLSAQMYDADTALLNTNQRHVWNASESKKGMLPLLEKMASTGYKGLLSFFDKTMQGGDAMFDPSSVMDARDVDADHTVIRQKYAKEKGDGDSQTPKMVAGERGAGTEHIKVEKTDGGDEEAIINTDGAGNVEINKVTRSYDFDATFAPHNPSTSKPSGMSADVPTYTTDSGEKISQNPGGGGGNRGATFFGGEKKFALPDKGTYEYMQAIGRMYGGDAWDPEGETTSLSRQLSDTQLVQMGFNPNDITGQLRRSTQLVQSEMFGQTDNLDPMQLQARMGMAQAVKTVGKFGAMASSTNSFGENKHAILSHAKSLVGNDPEFLAELTGGMSEEAKTQATLFIGGAKGQLGDPKSEKASDAFTAFTSEIEDGVPEFVRSFQQLRKAFDGTAEVQEQHLLDLKSWQTSFKKITANADDAYTTMTQTGKISAGQFEALKDVQLPSQYATGADGKTLTDAYGMSPLVSKREDGTFAFDKDLYSEFSGQVKKQLGMVEGSVEKRAERQSQASATWQEMFGFSNEGAKNTRLLNDAFNAPVIDGKFSEGRLAGMGATGLQGLRTQATITGASAYSAVTNPYNMFAANRIWGMTGKPMMNAMEQYQSSVMRREAMGFDSGMITGDQLAEGKYGQIQSRRANQGDLMRGFGRGADYAYGGLGSGIPDALSGVSSLAGYVAPAIGAGLAVSTLFKGAVSAFGGDGQAVSGLAGKLGTGISLAGLALGGFNYLGSAGSDKKAFADENIFSAIGAGLGEITQSGSAREKQQYKWGVESFEEMYRTGNKTSSSDYYSSTLGDSDKTSAKLQAFSRVNEDEAKARFGDDYEAQLQSVYRVGEAIDPSGNILLNQATATKMMDLQLRYGEDTAMQMALNESQAMGSERPNQATFEKTLDFMLSGEDKAMLLTQQTNATNAMSMANNPRAIAGMDMLDRDYFMQYQGNFGKSFAGQMQGQIAQSVVGSNYTTGNERIFRRAEELALGGDYSTAQRYLNAGTTGAGVSDAMAQRFALRGVSNQSGASEIGGAMASTALEQFAENPDIAQGLMPLIEQMAQSTGYQQSLQNRFGFNPNFQGDIVPGTPVNTGIMQEWVASTTGEFMSQEQMSDKFRNQWIPQTEDLIAGEWQQIANVAGGMMVRGADMQGLASYNQSRAGLSRVNDSSARNEMTANMMWNLWGASDESINQQTLQGAQVGYFNNMNQVTDPYLGSAFTDLVGDMDFTNEIKAGNASSTLSQLQGVYQSSPELTANQRSLLFNRTAQRGGFGFDSQQALYAQQMLSQTTGTYKELQQQGFVHGNIFTSAMSAGTSPEMSQVQNLITSSMGGALQAGMFNVNRANFGAVADVENTLLGQYGGIDLTSDSGRMEAQSLYASNLTAGYRQQMGRAGQRAGVSFESMGMSNDDLATDSVREGVTELFQSITSNILQAPELKTAQRNMILATFGGSATQMSSPEFLQQRSQQIGQYGQAYQTMQSRYLATGGDVGQMNARALEMASLSPQQFAQSMGIENQNQYVMSQNLGQAQARWGVDGAPIAPIDLKTGLQTTMTNFTPGGNMNYANIAQRANSLYGGGMLAGYMDNQWMSQAGGTLGIQGSINSLQMGQAFASVNFQRQQNSLQRNLNMGQGTLDNQGYVTGGDGLSSFGQSMRANGFNFNVGNGMSLWQVDDARTKLSRQQQEYSWQTQGRDREMEMRHFTERFGLKTEQFNFDTAFKREDMSLDRGRQLTQRGWNVTDMNVSRQQQVTQFAWQAEDNSTNRARSALEQGWRNDDYGRQGRYAKGRDRLDLIRNQERDNIRYSLDVAQSDKTDARQNTQEQWADEQFTRQTQRFNETIQFEDTMYQRSVNRFEKGVEFEQRQMDMEKRHFEEKWGLQGQDFERQKANMLEMQKLEDQDRLLQRQWQNASTDMQLRFSESVASTNKQIAELQNSLTVFGLASEMVAKKLELYANIMETGASPVPGGAPAGGGGRGDASGDRGHKLPDPKVYDTLNVSIAKASEKTAELTVSVDKGSISLTQYGLSASKFAEVVGRSNVVSTAYNAVLVQQSNAVQQNVVAVRTYIDALNVASNYMLSATGSFDAYNARIVSTQTTMQQSLGYFDQFNSRVSALVAQLNSLTTGQAQGGWTNVQSSDLASIKTNTSYLAQIASILGTISANTGSALNPSSYTNNMLTNIRKDTLQTARNGNPQYTGYKDGGYTGDGPADDVAGVVHNREYVVPMKGALLKGGSSEEEKKMVKLLEKIEQRLSSIEGMGPGRLNVNAIVNRPEAINSIINDADRARALPKDRR